MRRFLSLIAVASLLLVCSCESIDCTLNNIVLCYYSFYDSEGNPLKFSDTLTITMAGTDSVLLNRATGVSKFTLPMSYAQKADTLLLTLYGEEYCIRETIVMEKENIPHFESPDCPATMFHHITAVENPNSLVFDSVTITKPTVNYQTDENIKIYIHTAP